MSRPVDGTAEELLEDYAELLRYLADTREHGSEGKTQCTGVGSCIKCSMRAKADKADDAARSLEQGLRIVDDELVRAARV